MARNYIKLKQLEPTGLASLVRTSQTGDHLTTGYSGYVSDTFYPRSNPSGYVRAAETGILAGTGTGVAEGTGWVNANYVGRSESGTFYEASNPSGYVRAAETGILAGTGTGVTEGTGWVNANYYPRNNPSGFKAPIIIVSGIEPPSGDFDESGNLWLDTTGDCKPVLKAYDRCTNQWTPATTIGQLPAVAFSPFVNPTNDAYYTFVDVTDSDTVTMSVAGHPNASIYYTLNSGTNPSGLNVSGPTAGSNLYSSPVELTNTGTGALYYAVKAKAYLSYYSASNVSSGIYRLNPRYPKVEFSPHHGYPSTDLNTITLTVPDHSGTAKIYYTLTTGTRDFIETGNHTAPTATVYTNTGTSPLSINVSSYQNVSYNIKAFAGALPNDTDGKRRSLVSSASYASTLGGAYGQNPSLEGIDFSPDTIEEGAGIVSFPVQCIPSMISHSLEDGLAFYYKTDGSEPSISNYNLLWSGSTNSYITLDGDTALDDDALVKLFATKYGYAPTQVTTGSYTRKGVVVNPPSGTEARFGNYTGFTMQGYNHIFYTTGDSSTGSVPDPSVNACDLSYSAPTQKYTGQFFFPADTLTGTIKYFGLATSGCASTIVIKTGNYPRRKAESANLSLPDGTQISGNNCEEIVLSSADTGIHFYVTSGTSTPADPTPSDFKVTGADYTGDCCAAASGTGVFTVCPGYTYKFLVSGTGLNGSDIVTANYDYYYANADTITFSPTTTTQDFSGNSFTVNISNGYSGFATTGLTSTIDNPIVTGDSNLENWTASGSNAAFAVSSGDVINFPLNNTTASEILYIKAIAVLDGHQPSQTVKSKNYNKKKAASITFDPDGGVISALGEQVVLSSSDSSPIEYYIETGNPTAATPTTGSSGYFADYAETLNLNPTDQIKVFAWRKGLTRSNEQVVTYQIGQTDNDITVSPVSGSQIRFGASEITFNIPSNASGYYTTGIGSAPEDPIVTGNATYTEFNPSGSNSAQAYSSPVVLPYTNESAQESGYIKFIMVTGGYQPSDVLTTIYTKRRATAPVLDPANGDGVLATGEELSITTTDTDIDFYINSGATLETTANPTTGSSGYARDLGSSFTVFPTGDIRAMTWGSGLIPSTVTSADYKYLTQDNDLKFNPKDDSLIDFSSENISVTSLTADALIFAATGTGLSLADPVITGNETYSEFGISESSAFRVNNSLDVPDTAYNFRIKAVVASTGKLVSSIASKVYGNTLLPAIVAQSVSGVTPAYPNGSYDLVTAETFTFKVTGKAGLSPTIEWYHSGSAGEQQISDGGNYTITETNPNTEQTFSQLEVIGNSNSYPVFYAKIFNDYGTITGDQTTVKFYSSRIADPVVVVPSGGQIANNGALLDITTQTGSSSTALTFVRLKRGISLSSLPDPTGDLYWEKTYTSTPYPIYNDTVNKLWSSGDGVARTNVLGFSYLTGAQQNQNFLNPNFGTYYDYIDVNIPSGGFEVYTTNGFITPELGLIYNSGTTGAALSAPTTGSYSGAIALTYDEGTQEYTGRLNVGGDFDIKTLIIESGSSYGVNWTGEVSTSFENRIKFASVKFLKNLTWEQDPSQSKVIGYSTDIGTINPVKVKSYAASILALDGNNNLWAFGSNSYGQLANGTTSTVSTPTKVGENIKDFDIGYSHSAVISGDYDELLFAGTSYNGEIPYQKDATVISNRRTSFTSVGTEDFDRITGIGKIACGGAHTMFVPNRTWGIFTGGSVYTNGYNNYGHLGRPTNYDYDQIPSNNSMRFDATNVAEISAGAFHSAVIRTNGDLYVFGHNNQGQLGRGNTAGDSYAYSSSISAIASNAAKVSLGAFHSTYVATDDKLYTFGYNYFNQVRPDTTSRQLTPYNVLNNIKDVSLGGSHTVALSGSATNGSLYGFGYNYNGQIKSPISLTVSTPHLISTGIDSGDFAAEGLHTFYIYSTSGYTYDVNNDNNLAVLNYTTGTGGYASGVASGANTIAIELESLGSSKPVNAAIRYSIDGSDPTGGNFAYILKAQQKSGITGVTNFFFLPETGLTPYATGTSDLTLKYIAISTGTSTGDISDSFSTTTVIERKTLSPQIKVTYYDDILDTTRAVSGYSATGFSDLFNRNATVDINFVNYDTDSSGALSFYKNGSLQSTNKTSATRTFEITTTDNTNTGTLTFSGFASGYKVTGADVTGIFERHRLFSGAISADNPSGTYNAAAQYIVKIDNNINNPSDSIIKYTKDGTEPNKNSINYVGPIGLEAAPDPGMTHTIRHKVYKDGYLISPEGDSGVYTVVEFT
jgi:alpha-tubulin suppressor-like RCC1 family protein